MCSGRGISKSECGEILIEVRDKNGKVIVKRKEKINSFLYNYYSIARVWAVKGIATILKDTSGNNTPTINSWNIQNSAGANAPEGDDSYGIVVGSGSTPVDVQNDYNLANKISNGTGSGQLQYGSTSMTDDMTQLPKMILEVKRTFINNSGDNVTVNEIGLVIKINDGSNDYNVMIVRDVITATTVPNGGTLAVTYKLSIN